MKRLLLLLTMAFSLNAVQAQFREFTIEPGDFSQGGLLIGIEATELKVNGRMLYDADFRGISINWAGKDRLQKLDLSGITEIINDNGDVTGQIGFLRSFPELTEVILPEGSVAIRLLQAFQNCPKLSKINIPNSVVSITNLAFNGCTALESIELPASLERLDYSQVFHNSGLKSITVHAAVPPLVTAGSFGTFGNLVLKDLTLYVPTAVLERYKDHAVWGEFGTIETIVVKQEQTIENFADQLANVGDEITFPANTQQGLPVTYSMEAGKESVATLNGNKLSLTGLGEVKITAIQAGNDEYAVLNKTITVTTSIDYSWLEEVSIAVVDGNTAKVVGPPAAVVRFTKFYVNDAAVTLTSGVADLSEKTGELSLKATTDDGSEVIRLKIQR